MDRSSVGGSKGIFPTGPSFTLEDFSSKDFIVRDFVDSLTESSVPTNRRSGPSQSTFDPKPLIRTFESVVSQLGALKDDLQETESELLSQVRRAEIQHDQTLDTLGRKLDETMTSFEALDFSMNQASVNGHVNGNSNGNGNGNVNVNGNGNSNGNGNGNGNDTHKADAGGNVAVQIGEKLEELDKKRRRAQDAIFLIHCWTEVSETGLLSSLEDIRRQGGAENKVRCAVIARQLMRISQQLDPISWGHANGRRSMMLSSLAPPTKQHNTREILEKFCETLEQDLLQQFNNSYKRQNFDDMMECAKVLYDFNGGASVIAVFVNQHQFFIDRDQLMIDEMAADGDVWETLADPDAEPPGVEASLQSLIDEVKIVMQEESFIIKRAFPYYETVLIKFIQRVFQQSIQTRLEKVLDKAETISTLAFLRSLHSSRNYIGALVEDLKMHGLTEHPEPCSAQISQALDQQLDELFVPYLVGNVFIEREKKSLEEMYGSLLFKFSIFHSRRKKAPTGFMASLAQQGTQLIQSAKDAYLERLESSELSPTQKAMMLRVAGLQDKGDKEDIEVSDEDGILSVANAKRMLKWLSESVQRVLEMGSSVETPKDVNNLLSLLLQSMSQVYVETALDAAHLQATMMESVKTEPDLNYLPAIRPAVTIAAIMQRFINVVLIRLAESNTTVRKSMEAQNKMAVDSIEKRTNAIMKVSIDVIGNWVTKLLSAQKKQDFRPKDGELESLQTLTCLSICTFLARSNKLAGQAIDGHNAEKFFSEVGLVIHRLLFDHFKKFQVNATGGLMVTQDIAKYVATLRDWPLSRDVATMVEMLTEIGSLFIVGPEALREKSRSLAAGSMATRGKLSKVDFKAFVQKRDDSGSAGIQSILNGI